MVTDADLNALPSLPVMEELVNLSTMEETTAFAQFDDHSSAVQTDMKLAEKRGKAQQTVVNHGGPQ